MGNKKLNHIKHNTMEKFKQLNQFEYLGLVSLLKNPFPFIEEITCGTCKNNLINLQNTKTEHQPNSEFTKLGAFGLSYGNDIILEFWNNDEELSKLYYITYRDLRDWQEYDNYSNYDPFNKYLKRFT